MSNSKLEAEIKDFINVKIQRAVESFTEWNEAHSRRMAEIDGMVEVLSILTQKEYIVSESGLEERVK